MSHSSNFPCTWCYAPKQNLKVSGELRTTNNLKKNYIQWSQAGAVKANAKDFKNCIHLPILTSSSDVVILDLIPPPELHLLLGVVNTVFGHMLKEFEMESLKWAKTCYVKRMIVHGAPAFKGNACKKLLDKVDTLRSISSLGCLK